MFVLFCGGAVLLHCYTTVALLLHYCCTTVALLLHCLFVLYSLLILFFSFPFTFMTWISVLLADSGARQTTGGGHEYTLREHVMEQDSADILMLWPDPEVN